MGLPCSTTSLARRVDLYSWTQRGFVWRTYLDLDQIASGKLAGVPEPIRFKDTSATCHGTIVALSACDRLSFQRVATLENHLHREFGRVFCRALLGGFCLSVNGRSVAPIDPLFLEGGRDLAKAQPYGPPLEFAVRAGDRVAPVQVRFSVLPIKEWFVLPNEAKSRYGISKGAGVSIVRGGR